MLVTALADGSLEVDIERGMAAIGDTIVPVVATVDGTLREGQLSTARAMVALRDRGLVTGGATLLASLDEWTELHRRDELNRVAIYLEVEP